PAMLRLFRHYIPGTLLVVAAVDVVVILGAIGLVSSLTPWMGEGPLWPKAAALSLIVVFALHLADLYDTALQTGRGELAVRILLSLLASAVVAAVAEFALPPLRFGRLAFLQIMSVLSAGLLVWRMAWAGITTNGRLRKRVRVLGVSGGARTLFALQTTGARPVTVLGCLADD